MGKTLKRGGIRVHLRNRDDGRTKGHVVLEHLSPSEILRLLREAEDKVRLRDLERRFRKN